MSDLAFTMTYKPPVHVPTVKVEIDKLSPKKGVSVCEFSCDGRYLCTKNDNMPNALWIWDLLTLSQAASFSSCHPSSSYIYLWSRENGCNAVEVPAINFQVGLMKWGPDGKSLV
ncbi:hypothetical protein BCR33DRAFT_784615 [Rhizoclosmatium globosum]|uniref:WD40 repeat-like protein n=1 Tax=Rhizoclosmatium globosum TaxID=329046 RepID=A0A1Y2CDR3_9FUNG|nr:hypothetical protein BCR33DRAFT_784615 [Rhizoclosmatium globosum]|eukprot:ORY45198.1 hypothetical protein BCR33DRAFT_784615 [Rhizoclosmatium globosum]